jgi:hypothetical protein
MNYSEDAHVLEKTLVDRAVKIGQDENIMPSASEWEDAKKTLLILADRIKFQRSVIDSLKEILNELARETGF